MDRIYKDLSVQLFEEKEDFYDWLAKNYDSLPAFWMRYYKKGSGKTSLAYTDAVDVALCWGWIDGLMNRYDDESYLLRFTPRRPKSVWSKINVDKVESLTREGLMQAPGLACVEAAKADGRWDAAYGGQSQMEIPPILGKYFEEDSDLRAKYEMLTRAEKYAIYFKITSSAGDERKQLVTSRIIDRLRKA